MPGVERKLALVEVADAELLRVDALEQKRETFKVVGGRGRADVEIVGEALDAVRDDGEPADNDEVDRGLVQTSQEIAGIERRARHRR